MIDTSETEIDRLIGEVASEIRRLNEIHAKVCAAAAGVTNLDEVEAGAAWRDLDLLSQSLRAAQTALQSGTIRTSFFTAEAK